MTSLRSLPFLLAVLLAACGGVRGSGNPATENRDVGAFSHVQVEDALHVTLTDRAAGSVTVTADDNLVPLILTEVRDGALYVHVKDHQWFSTHSELNVELPREGVNWVKASGASQVESTQGLVCEGVELDASGASTITLDGVEGSDLWLKLSGASEVKLRQVKATTGHVELSGASRLSIAEGNLDALELNASGASELKAQGLACKTATVDVSGASEVALSASESVSGRVSGASQLDVKGGPAMRSIDASGASDVQFE